MSDGRESRGGGRPQAHRFADRAEAGRILAAHLEGLGLVEPLVLAVPRGGVPVGAPVAHALAAPLDLVIVRKLGAPGHEEFAIGAVAEDGTLVVERELLGELGISRRKLEEVLESETRELRRRVDRYRGGRPAPDVKGRSVVVVDDGLATGLSDLAAVRSLRRRGATEIIVAAPVASQQAVQMLSQEADHVVAALVPEPMVGVGVWYADFGQTTDQEVMGLLGKAQPGTESKQHAADVQSLLLDAGEVTLHGDLTLPAEARGLVLFAHGSGSSRKSPRNRRVAAALARHGMATLLADLLSPEEEGRRDLVFDVPLLAGRLVALTRAALGRSELRNLPVGYFGASTGAAAALVAAAELGDEIACVVSRGGRPDLADSALAEVRAPTLLIVGSRDRDVLTLNRLAAEQLRCPHALEIVPGAGHLFEEPGTLDVVADLASGWFNDHLAAAAADKAR